MNRERALEAFDLLSTAGYPVTIYAHFTPRHVSEGYWAVSMGNLDHVELKGLVELLDEHGLAARSSAAVGGINIELAEEQHVRRIVG